MSCNNSSVKVFIPIIVYIMGLYDDVSMGLEALGDPKSIFYGCNGEPYPT